MGQEMLSNYKLNNNFEKVNNDFADIKYFEDF